MTLGFGSVRSISVYRRGPQKLTVYFNPMFEASGYFSKTTEAALHFMLGRVVGEELTHV